MSVLLAVLALLGAAGAALGAPDLRLGSSRFGNVFTTDESPSLTITVDSDRKPLRGQVMVSVEDAYGAIVAWISKPVVVAANASTSIEMPLPPGRLGYFSASARLLTLGGVRAEARTTLGVVPPIVEEDAERSAAGYFVYFDDAELPWANEIAAQMRRLGIRWVRLPFSWDADARRQRPDVTDPSWLDTTAFERWVDAFRANGIEVLAVLVGTARWASSAPDDDTVAYGIPRWAIVMPADVGAWEHMVSTVAQRLRGRVRSWEIWNEPDGVPFWGSTPAEFATLASVTARALRDVDPSARIVLNVVDWATESGRDFHLTVLAQAGPQLDVFGFHYGNQRIAGEAARMLPLLRRDAVLWDTEAHGPPRRNLTMWLDERAGGVERIFTFIYHRPLDDVALGFARFGFYPVNVDYTPRPDALVQRTLSDVVGSGIARGQTAAGYGWEAYWYDTDIGPAVALTNDVSVGSTWRGPPGVRVRLALPAGVQYLTAIDLMGNRQVYRVRRGRVWVRVLGVGAFFRSDPPDALTDVRVVGVKGARRLGQGRKEIMWR